MTSLPTPESTEAIFARLNEVSDNLPKRLKQCADFLSVHSDRIAVSTVSEAAVAAGVHPSAFIRFCQLLGFSGYSEMQKLFRNSYMPSLPDYETRLRNLRNLRERGTASSSAVLAEFIDAGRVSLEKLATSIEPHFLDRAVDVLARSDTIHLIGLKRAFPVATYLAYAFEKMDVPSILHDRAGRFSLRHAIRQNDVLIAITFTPFAEETQRLVLECVERTIPVVAITDSASGPLNRDGILPLRVSEVDFGAFRSLSATLSLAIALAVSVGAEREELKSQP